MSYEWKDSTAIPIGSKNIVQRVDCYGIDKDFLKIGDIAHYDCLKNGKSINNVENALPKWSYIIPNSEGEIIANKLKEILEMYLPFNEEAYSLYTKNKYYDEEEYDDND